MVIGLRPILEVHEGGHALACIGQGFTAKRTSFNTTDCNIGNEGLFLYRFAGGTFAAAVFTSPVVLWHRFQNHIIFRGIIVGLLGYAAGELGKGIAEAVDFAFYASDAGDLTFAIVNWITVFTLAFFLRPKRNLDLAL